MSARGRPTVVIELSGTERETLGASALFGPSPGVAEPDRVVLRRRDDQSGCPQPSGCIRPRCRSGATASPLTGSKGSVMRRVLGGFARSRMRRSKRSLSTRWSRRPVRTPIGRREGWRPSTGSRRPRWLRSCRAFGLKPGQQDRFKVSPDPDLVEKVRDLVGLYMNPPEAAAVFAADEKPQIQALNRTAPDASVAAHHAPAGHA